MAAGTDIFISYKREEQATAEAYAKAFRAKGYRVVTDLNLPDGERFGKAIETMIGEATLVVVLWTAASALSEWVQLEAVEAQRLRKYYGIFAKPVSVDQIPIEVRGEQALNVSTLDLDEGIAAAIPKVEAKLLQRRAEASKAATPEDAIADDMEFYTAIDEVGDLTGYAEYLKRYPVGVYREEARARIAALKQDESKARDSALFSEMDQIGKVDGYRHYLVRYPGGMFRNDALARIRELTHWTQWFKRNAGSIAAVTLAVVALVGTFATLYSSRTNELVQRSQADLKQQIATNKTLDAENDRLLAGLQAAKQQLSELTQPVPEALTKLEAENTDLQDQLSRKQAELGELQSELEMARGAYSEENEKLMAAGAEINRLSKVQANLLIKLDAQKDSTRSITDRKQMEAPSSDANPDLNQVNALRDFGCRNNAGVTILNTCRLLDTDLLIFTSQPITDLSPLAALTDLVLLNLNNSSIRDISGISRLQNLKSLFLQDTRVSDISALSELLSLNLLSLGGTRISDLTDLRLLTGLRALTLSNTQVSDLTPLRGMSELRTLNLGKTEVSDLTPLQGMAGLQNLFLEDTEVTELKPLQRANALRTLNLTNTNVKDLTPLQSLTGLRRLFLGATQVKDLSPLYNLKELHEIVLPDGTKAGGKNSNIFRRSSVKKAIREWKP